jgi:integrase
MAGKLTEKTIREATREALLNGKASASSSAWLWDVGGIPGFGVRIQPNGRKSYVCWYRTAEHREKRLVSLGSVASKSLTKAREDARAVLAAADAGGDPVQQRQAANRADTVKDLMGRYLVEHAKPHKKASSVASDQRLIDAVIVPALGNRKVAALSPADIDAFHVGMAATPFQANRVLALLSKALALASGKWGIRPVGSNPCKGIKRYKEQQRDRRIMPAELVEIGKALQQAEADNSAQPGAVLAVRLLAMLGCRAGDVCNLKWSHVDLGARLLRLPDSKTGGKTLSIGQAAVGLLSGLTRRGDYVCGGPDASEPLSYWTLQSTWKRICEAAKVSDLRLHDLRHAAATAAADAGFSAFQVKALLGHSSIQMAQRYVSKATDPSRGAADHVAAQMAAALGGQAPAVRGRK